MLGRQDTCPDCGESILSHRGMRCTLSSELELARFKKAHILGEAKNPSWYKKPMMPKPVEYDFKQKLPSLFTPQRDTWLDRREPNMQLAKAGVNLGNPANPAEYIKHFSAISHHVQEVS